MNAEEFLKSKGWYMDEDAKQVARVITEYSDRQTEELKNAVRRLLPAGVNVEDYLQAIKGKPEPY